MNSNYFKDQIEKLLKDLSKYYGDDEKKTADSVYYFLTKYYVPSEEKSFKVNSLFQDWINYFKHKPNINVFVSPNWQYFCQFTNLNYDKSYPLNNPIKIYLHVGSKEIFEVAKILFEFLSINNIVHQSKIGSNIRIDDIVIRVYSKNDYNKIRDFIARTPKVNNALRNSFPISFHDDKICLALDRDLSFNQIVSSYLYWYVVDSKKNAQEISYNNFLQYLLKIYQKVFIKKDKNAIDFYMERYFDEHYSESPKYLLNNYHEITKVILESLKENTFENYLETVDFCNNKELINERVHDYSNILKQENVTESDILLVKECILIMCKKYGALQTITNLEIFLQNGALNRITRDNHLRERFAKQISRDKFQKILGSKSVQMYVDEVINSKSKPNKTGEFLKANKIYETAKNNLNTAILETYKKYGIEQVVYAVTASINGNYNYFTNNNQARRILSSSVTPEQISYLVNKFGENNPSNYVIIVLQNYGYDFENQNKSL